MGFFDDRHDDYQQYDNAMQSDQPPNEASFGHEALAGGAAFAAMKVFEDRQRKEGKPVSHQFAKELLAGLAGAEVDRFSETTGADWVDKEKAKREAKKHAEDMYDDHYGQYDQYDPNTQDPPKQVQRYMDNY